MEDSFPVDEYRSYDGQKRLRFEKLYTLYSVKNDGIVIAFVAVWEFNDFLFIEHLAVKSDVRGKGIGSDILYELKKIYDKPICLEVEPPIDNVTRKRISFYQRCGFYLNDFAYMQPAMDGGKSAIPLMIMSSNGELDKKEFENVKNTLYTFVYKIGGEI